MRDSMVLYRSFIDSILKLETQFNAETALKLFKAVAKYGLDGVVDDDMDPLIDLLFTNIKPQIDANTKRFVNGKKGGRPKKTKGNADTEPKVIDNKTIGYESKNHRLLDDKTIGYENENLRLSDKKPNDNVNDNVNVNENLNNNENIKEKKSLSFAFEKIKNPHLLTLEQYEKEAANIVLKYYQNLGFKYEDFMIVMPKEVIMLARIENGRFEKSFKTLQKEFFTYIYKKNITNIQSLQIHIKEIQRVKHLKTTPDIPDKITEAVRLATQKNYTKIYLDNIK
jgi:hypothetical protein